MIETQIINRQLIVVKSMLSYSQSQVKVGCFDCWQTRESIQTNNRAYVRDYGQKISIKRIRKQKQAKNKTMLRKSLSYNVFPSTINPNRPVSQFINNQNQFFKVFRQNAPTQQSQMIPSFASNYTRNPSGLLFNGSVHAPMPSTHGTLPSMRNRSYDAESQTDQTYPTNAHKIQNSQNMALVPYDSTKQPQNIVQNTMENATKKVKKESAKPEGILDFVSFGPKNLKGIQQIRTQMQILSSPSHKQQSCQSIDAAGSKQSFKAASKQSIEANGSNNSSLMQIRTIKTSLLRTIRVVQTVRSSEKVSSQQEFDISDFQMMMQRQKKNNIRQWGKYSSMDM